MLLLCPQHTRHLVSRGVRYCVYLQNNRYGVLNEWWRQSRSLKRYCLSQDYLCEPRTPIGASIITHTNGLSQSFRSVVTLSREALPTLLSHSIHSVIPSLQAWACLFLNLAKAVIRYYISHLACVQSRFASPLILILAELYAIGK